MKTLLLTASSGGHLEQLMCLKKKLIDKYNIYVITEKTQYAKQENDTFFVNQLNRKSILFPFKFIQNHFKIKKIIKKVNPDVVISTGVLCTISTCWIAHKKHKKVIFIESFAKVNSPTKTGKVIHKYADEFVVQWPEMLEVYQDAKYFGGIY